MNETITQIISRELMVDELDVVPDAILIDDLGADSLALVDLAMALEDEFDIQISDDELEDIKTVNDIYNYINSHTDDE